MRTLVLDTATPALTLALWQGGEMTAHFHEVIGRGHAERLVPAFAGLPEGGRAERIVVGVGPGSFTGIRVGVAAARALGLAWGIEVFGLSTLALLAAAGESADPVLAVLNGGHGEAFVQRFGGEPLQPLEAVGVVPLGRLSSTRAGGAAVGRSTLIDHVDHLWVAEVDAARFGRVAHLATLSPSPFYARAPDAVAR